MIVSMFKYHGKLFKRNFLISLEGKRKLITIVVIITRECRHNANLSSKHLRIWGSGFLTMTVMLGKFVYANAEHTFLLIKSISET